MDSLLHGPTLSFVALAASLVVDWALLMGDIGHFKRFNGDLDPSRGRPLGGRSPAPMRPGSAPSVPDAGARNRLNRNAHG